MEITAGRPSQIELSVPDTVRSGLALLLQAARYAGSIDRDRWDFAVEIGALRSAGLNRSDLRWLICAGYVEHGREISEFGSMGREFQCSGGLVFSRRSAFVLTASGMRAAEASLRTTSPSSPGVDGSADTNITTPPMAVAVGSRNGVVTAHASIAAQPRWDRDRHELRMGTELVKIFKLPSPKLEMVLAAFEEEDWPPRIDDPLPPAPDLEPKRRLHDTIKSLNRNQKRRLIRFMGDGTGQGIQRAAIDPDGNDAG